MGLDPSPAPQHRRRPRAAQEVAARLIFTWIALHGRLVALMLTIIVKAFEGLVMGFLPDEDMAMETDE